MRIQLSIATIAVCFLMLLPIGQSRVRLPFMFVNCTGGIVAEDQEYADKNGRLGQTVETTGSLKLYQQNVDHPVWLLYSGVFDLNIHNISLGDLSKVAQLVFDFKYTIGNDTFCMRIA